MKKTLLTLWAVVACIALYAQPANDNCADAISVTTDEVVDFFQHGIAGGRVYLPNSLCLVAASS